MVKVIKLICIAGILALLVLFVLFTGNGHTSNQKTLDNKAFKEQSIHQQKSNSKSIDKAKAETDVESDILQMNIHW